ncbi:MAG: thioesterase family protein [Myxococcota bacterium]
MALREEYPHFLQIPTRWMDNDVYGHVNNVVYYAYFDTAVNRFLIERKVLDIHQGPVIGYVVESSCRYERPLSFPDVIDAGLRVARIGNSSVQYELALFRQGEASSSADGRFVHVYVDRQTQRPTPIPDEMRAALSTLLAPSN